MEYWYMNFSAWRHRGAAKAAAMAAARTAATVAAKAAGGVSAVLFILRNLWRGRGLAPFSQGSAGAFLLRPCTAQDLPEVVALYAMLNGGKRLELPTHALLRLRSACFCLTARHRGDNRLAGIALYYFNAYDDARGMRGAIHVAYTGLVPSARGMGVGAGMRRHALRHFARSGLDYASSRISTSNLPSLNGNLKLGFRPVEIYFDRAMEEQRQYLICKLDRYR
jgi:GNAT superfamily N-acetyltransferase